MRRAVRNGRWTVAAVMIALAACSSTPDRPEPGSDTTTYQQGRYKIGRPYQIKGRWYYPAVDYAYSEVGTASWYGPNFDGQPTANGEIYDMDAFTAAHRTLPLPSIVKVTNLENGRSVKLRVNDRGPFYNDRIIDVSRRASQELGFYGRGTTRVRVDIVADESLALADQLTGGQGTLALGQTPTSSMVAAADPPPGGPVLGTVPADSVVSEPVAAAALAPVVAPAYGQRPRGGGAPPPAGGAAPVFVQAGAFADPGNADRARTRLAGLGAPVDVTPFTVNGRNLFRVRIGPLDGRQDVNRVVANAIDAGFPASRVVVD